MLTIPFPGSKRNSYKHIKKLVKENNYTKIYEPFGGSGILSVNLYNDGLIEEATINDYDELFKIYPEFLDVKDFVVNKCYELGLKKQTERHSKTLPEEEQKILKSVINEVDKKWWPLLARGSCFCFSSVSNRNPEHIRLCDFRYFKRGLDTKPHRDYLDVVNKLTVVTLDYKDFLEKFKKEFDERTLLIVDPPYVGTYQGQYGNNYVFTKEDTLELLDYLDKLGIDYIFFNEYVDFLEDFINSKENIEIVNQKRYCQYNCKPNPKDFMFYVKNYTGE